MLSMCSLYLVLSLHHVCTMYDIWHDSLCMPVRSYSLGSPSYVYDHPHKCHQNSMLAPTLCLPTSDVVQPSFPIEFAPHYHHPAALNFGCLQWPSMGCTFISVLPWHVVSSYPNWHFPSELDWHPSPAYSSSLGGLGTQPCWVYPLLPGVLPAMLSPLS
jgi:hypothetical protein